MGQAGGPLADRRRPPRLLALASRLARRPLTSRSRLLKPLSPTLPLNRAYARLRRKLLRAAGKFLAKAPDFDDFMLEAWNPGDRAIRMVLECRSHRPVCRTTFPLHAGRNWLRFPAAEFAGAPADAPPLLAVHPDIWRRVLTEDGPEALTVRDAAVEAIQRLDARGILHSVASKNDRCPAWRKIGEVGLGEFFLCPASNWLPKSRNLQQIAHDLNLGLDTLAFVDDPAFERGEVRTLLPEVRVCSEAEVARLARRPEFDVPVTTASRLRRASYLQEVRCRSIAVGFQNDCEAFLECCELESLAFTPCEDADRQRCLELLHRSNQLNLSTRRYGTGDFLGLLSDAATLSVAWSCQDRFGDYGPVGFLAVAFGAGQPARGASRPGSAGWGLPAKPSATARCAPVSGPRPATPCRGRSWAKPASPRSRSAATGAWSSGCRSGAPLGPGLSRCAEPARLSTPPGALQPAARGLRRRGKRLGTVAPGRPLRCTAASPHARRPGLRDAQRG